MMSSPGTTGPPIACLEVRASPRVSRARPASSGAIRQAEGSGGVTRRLTPSGEMRTRSSDSSAAMTAAAGTPSRTMR